MNYKTVLRDLNMQIFTLIKEYIICLFSKNTITISHRLLDFTITNHEKQGELMVRSLYQIGALIVIKTLFNMQIFMLIKE